MQRAATSPLLTPATDHIAAAQWCGPSTGVGATIALPSDVDRDHDRTPQVWLAAVTVRDDETFVNLGAPIVGNPTRIPSYVFDQIRENRRAATPTGLPASLASLVKQWDGPS